VFIFLDISAIFFKKSKMTRLLFAFLLITSLLSCNTDTPLLTAGGHEITFHTDIPGPTPSTGDYVFFYTIMENGEKVTFDSHTLPEVPKSQIANIEAIKASPKKYSPVTEALIMMSKGDSVTLKVNIAGNTSRPKDYENSDFAYFHIKMEDLKSELQEATDAQKASDKIRSLESNVAINMGKMISKYNEGALGDGLKTTASGLKYYIVHEGEGLQAVTDKNVLTHSYGALLDNKMFDNSYKTGKLLDANLGQSRFIKGWEEGVCLLKEGGSAYLFVPAALAYGATGNEELGIPPFSDLVFYIDLESVRDIKN